MSIQVGEGWMGRCGWACVGSEQVLVDRKSFESVMIFLRPCIYQPTSRIFMEEVIVPPGTKPAESSINSMCCNAAAPQLHERIHWNLFRKKRIATFIHSTLLWFHHSCFREIDDERADCRPDRGARTLRKKTYSYFGQTNMMLKLDTGVEESMTQTDLHEEIG